jgi:hypothetical protein
MSEDNKQQEINIIHVLDTVWGEFREDDIVRIVPNKPTMDMNIKYIENLSLIDKHFNVIVGKLKRFDEHYFTLDVSEKYDAMTIRIDVDDIEDMSIVGLPSYEIVKNLTHEESSEVDRLKKELTELQDRYNMLSEGYHRYSVNLHNALYQLQQDIKSGKLGG